MKKDISISTKKKSSENKKELNYRNYKINEFINLRAYGNPQIFIKRKKEIEINLNQILIKLFFMIATSLNGKFMQPLIKFIA